MGWRWGVKALAIASNAALATISHNTALKEPVVSRTAPNRKGATEESV